MNHVDVAPVPTRSRIAALDALRGAALFGILLINIQSFQGPEGGLEAAGEAAYSAAERTAVTVLTALVQMKFIGAFAFLFGLGLALQGARVDARGGRSGPLLTRRLLVLAVIGALHAVLIWSGDILFTYAVIGLLALPLRRSPPRALLGAAAGAYAVALAILAANVAVTLLLAGDGGAATDATTSARGAAEAYASGDYGAMLAQRLDELGRTALSLVVNGPWVFAMIAAGMATVRAGILDHLEDRRPWLRRVATVGLGAGLPLNVLAALALDADPSALSAIGAAAQLLLFAGAPVLTAGYLAGGALWFLDHPDHALTRALSAVGRMALTNYLLQSVIATALFYGAGLYGDLGLLGALALCPLIYAANVGFSLAWLARFPQGPLEALWRRLTYGRG